LFFSFYGNLGYSLVQAGFKPQTSWPLQRGFTTLLH